MATVELLTSDPVTLVFDYGRGIAEKEYVAFCQANPDLRCERSAEGAITVMPPAGGEGSYRSMEAAGMLREWARKDGRGRAFDSSVQFMLPDGSGLSPDAAWVSHESLRRLSRAERREFLRLSPEFVIEVMSPSDRLKPAKAKMESWIANGVELGWLIDADHETVHVYRQGRTPVARRGIRQIAGEGSVKGFVLDLHTIWRGLAD